MIRRLFGLVLAVAGLATPGAGGVDLTPPPPALLADETPRNWRFPAKYNGYHGDGKRKHRTPPTPKKRRPHKSRRARLAANARRARGGR